MKNVKVSEAFMKRFGHERIIALMPGSRHYDIKHHLDTLIGTAEILRREGKFLPVFSVAPGLSEELSDELMRRVNDSGFEFWNGEGRELMLGSCAVAGVSGTVAVEAMMLNRFMVVIYNMNQIIYAILKRIVHVKKISVPNMLTDKQIFPELLCDDATPENIVRELHRYLDDDVRRREIDSSLDEAKTLMGEENAASFWADCIANM
jgi:lipid-A-disaccharide synthase